MKQNYDNTMELLDSLTTDLTPETIMFEGQKGIIAAEISMKRQDMNMNQKQFAEYMGVTQSQVSKWETGECNFTLETLCKIASKLEISMQCPFVTPSPPVYSSNMGKIIPIDQWSAGYRSQSHYERLEM